jgi:hypothetical protein
VDESDDERLHSKYGNMRHVLSQVDDLVVDDLLKNKMTNSSLLKTYQVVDDL